MRTRDELLKLEADGTSPVSPESWAVLEVLIDIRDELVNQGKPTEVIAEQAPSGFVHYLDPLDRALCGPKFGGLGTLRREECTHDVAKVTCLGCRAVLDLHATKADLESTRAQIAFYRKTENGLARVGELVGFPGPIPFPIDECVQRVRDHVASSEAHDRLRATLSTYLGVKVAEPNETIIAAVKALGSLAQDRKDLIEVLEREKAELAAEVKRWEEGV